jgi:hypothetical protein
MHLFKIHCTVFLIYILLSAWVARAQTKDARDSLGHCYEPVSKTEVGMEYLTPTRFVNQIRTVSVHGYFWKKRFEKISIKVSTGFICTYAWGTSRQFEELGDSAVLVTTHQTSAFGAGPILQVDPTIIKLRRLSVIAEVDFGVILYSNRFPYGGDVYNFIFKGGPSLDYKINRNSSFRVGYRWMHVSNGQGNGNHNPFYEGYGLNVSFLTFR